MAMAEWVFGESRVQESKDDLFVKLYNLAPENVAFLAALSRWLPPGPGAG